MYLLSPNGRYSHSCKVIVWLLAGDPKLTNPQSYLVVLVCAITILLIGLHNLRGLGMATATSLWNQGLGTINPNAIFTALAIPGSESGILRDVVLINSPQLVLSVLHFLYNSIFTGMLAGQEWSMLRVQRKALRVSKPRGHQRSTYWLSLPWKCSIPLMTSWAFMHWFVSRSLFLVRINVYDFENEPEPERDVSACGYSPLAIILVIAILVLMLFVLVACSLRPLSPGPSIAGTCSWAISATCHRPADDVDAAIELVKWGVTEAGSLEMPGHCCITSKEVQEPVLGHLYE